MSVLSKSCPGSPTPLILGMEWQSEASGGVGRYVASLHESLRREDPSAKTIVFGPVAERPPGVFVAERADAPLDRRLRSLEKGIRATSDGVDLVDAHFALYAVSSVAGRARNLPLVVHFHGPWGDESRSVGSRAPRTKRLIEQLVYRRAGEIVVLLRRVQADARRAVRDCSVADHRNPAGGRPRAIPSRRTGAGADRARASRRGMDCARGPQTRAAHRCRRPSRGVGADDWHGGERAPSYRGRGSSRPALEEQARRLGLGESVRFLGRVSDGDLPDYYRAADVSVVPSRSLEGFGLVVLEALASGTPVIASDTGGLPEALAPLDPSLLVPPAMSLRSSIVSHRYMHEEQLCRAATGARSYADRFSWDAVAARHRELYTRAVTPPRQRKLRVVYLDHCAKMSGGEIALLRLLPALREVEAHVVLAEDGPLVSRLTREGISLEVLPMSDAVRELPGTRCCVAPESPARRRVRRFTWHGSLGGCDRSGPMSFTRTRSRRRFTEVLPPRGHEFHWSGTFATASPRTISPHALFGSSARWRVDCRMQCLPCRMRRWSRSATWRHWNCWQSCATRCRSLKGAEPRMEASASGCWTARSLEGAARFPRGLRARVSRG